MSALVILGSGFDIDLGLENSCVDFSKSRLCPVAGNELWSSFENTLRSEIISWYKNGMDRQKAEDLNRLWQLYVRNISFFFTEQSDKYKIDKNTCAYRFLKHIKRHSKSKIYSFNYTNPYEYVDILIISLQMYEILAEIATYLLWHSHSERGAVGEKDKA